jgi:hypothetical protein
MQLRPLTFRIMTAVSLSLVATACHHEESGGGETQLRAASTPGAHACPMGVKGTSVTANDTSNGVALDFQTTAGPNEVADLQKRVHAMADAGSLGMMRGPGGGGGHAGRSLSSQVGGSSAARPRTRVEDTARGARVTIEPAEGAGSEGVDALRARAHTHAQRMATNEACMRARSGH